MNDMRAIPPSQPLAATLEAQDWNVVFGALNELPMRIARPVYDRIYSQIQHQLMQEARQVSDLELQRE